MYAFKYFYIKHTFDVIVFLAFLCPYLSKRCKGKQMLTFIFKKTSFMAFAAFQAYLFNAATYYTSITCRRKTVEGCATLEKRSFQALYKRPLALTFLSLAALVRHIYRRRRASSAHALLIKMHKKRYITSCSYSTL